MVAVLRSRRDEPSALVALADGRYAVVTRGVVAVGGRQALARWCERRAERSGEDPAERAWWQEVIGIAGLTHPRPRSLAAGRALLRPCSAGQTLAARAAATISA